MEESTLFKKYLTRPEGNCWVGRVILNGRNMKMVSRYGIAMIFHCEYDGETMNDEFETSNVNRALKWLYS
jgi:hypothetical protein